MARRLALGAISAYRMAVSPYLPSQCVYQPTCSNYATDAITTYGVLRGSWMALRRLLRCHPFTQGGYDPVPEDRN